MVNNIIILFIILTSFSLNAQELFRATLTDKANSPYSISQPSSFLSVKAIQRRANQNVDITLTDIPVNTNYLDSLKLYGATIITKSKWLNTVVFSINDTNNIQHIKQLPFIKDVVKVKPVITSKTNSNKLENYVNSLDYGAANEQIDIMEGSFLHDAGYLGQGILIAVIDAGFDQVDNIDFFDRLWNNSQLKGVKNIVNNDANVFTHHHHGTAVLSTMAAYKSGEMIGTAPYANYLLIRSEDAAAEYIAEEDFWVAAAEYADSAGAWIINSSLGYTEFDDSTYNHTYNDMDGNTTVITKGADIAASKGILVVNSAGNSGNKNWRYIGAPADGDSVLTIGAVDKNGSIAVFSSVGPTSDNRLKPNVCGVGALSTVLTTAGDVAASNGTSFSSPIIAGMAACLWQAYPTKTNMEIYKAIEESAHLYNYPNNTYGYGIPNFKQAYFNLAGINVEDENRDEIVLLYPNPTKNNIDYVYYSANTQQIEVAIIDVAGKKMSSKTYNLRKGQILSSTLSLATYAQGIYFLTVFNSKNKVVKKITKY